MHTRFICAALGAALLAGGPAAAQQVQQLNVSGPAPQLIDESSSEPTAASVGSAPVDLGQKNAAAPEEKTKIEDIVMLCSNCHSMIHRKKPWTTKDNLKT